MPHRLVARAMSREVIAVREDTPLKRVAAVLAEHRASGMPVVDDDGQVRGVLSRSDLTGWRSERAHRAAGQVRLKPPHQPGGAERRPARLPQGKAGARTAGDLMSFPAVTVGPRQNVVEAARVMARSGVGRLPVVDEEGRLVGIVSRTDLLSVFLRPDSAIREEIETEVLTRALWLAPGRVVATVYDGVVTLIGTVPRRSDVPIAVLLTSRVDGVVATVDRLDFDEDDTHYQPIETSWRGIADGWLHRF